MDRGGSKMLLQSIELKNFRQFIDEKIDFSVDPNQNVTIIIGENGTGKTTFAQAFFWCFYGETSFTDKIMINRKVFEKLTPDQEAEVRVAIKLQHGDAQYEIIRTQKYRKNFNAKPQAANTVLNIAVKKADGNTRYLKEIECDAEIKDILPKELSTYFFFDGERIEKMSKEIVSGRKSNSFAEAVSGLTGLKAISAAITHLSPTRINSVMGKFNEEYVDNSDGKIQKLTSEIDELQIKIDKAENRLLEIEDELESAKDSKKKFEEEIKQYADGEKLQNQRDKLNHNINSAKNTKAQFIKDLCRVFNSSMTTFFALPIVKRALEQLSDSDFSGKDIPEMHSKTIKYLLDRKMCICGTHLDEGTIPYNKVKELFEYLPPQSIGVTVGNFIKETRKNYGRKITLYQDVEEKLSAINAQYDTIAEYSNELNVISQKLDGKDVKEQVKNINKQINICEQTIRDRNREHDSLLINKGSCEKEKSLKETSRSELSLMNKNNIRIELYKAYTQRIYDELYKEYKTKEIETRNKLQKSINEIFKSIYDGGLSLSIDEKYNITVNVNDYEGTVETSTAQSISVIFAFISAIIKMAKENKESNADESYSEPYPLVMDAPLSAFDKRRIAAICSAIPETAEQVIIFIKDTDGELADEHLGNKIKTRHYFEKIDEFETHLK